MQPSVHSSRRRGEGPNGCLYARGVLTAIAALTREPTSPVLPERALEGPLLILSPHLVDAVLSCAALIERELPADVLTIFDGEPDPPRAGDWDLLTGFDDSASSMAARRAEDRAAFAGTPHRREGLGLLDLQYCGPDRPASDALRIAAAIEAWIERVEGGTIAAPAGAGRRRGRLRSRLEDRFGARGGPVQHPDHVLVRDAALSAIAGRTAMDLLVYEELPYLAGAPAEAELKVALRGVERSSVPIVVEIDRESKALRIAAYRSQVPHLPLWGGRVDDASALPEAERYWHLPGESAR